MRGNPHDVKKGPWGGVGGGIRGVRLSGPNLLQRTRPTPITMISRAGTERLRGEEGAETQLKKFDLSTKLDDFYRGLT